MLGRNAAVHKAQNKPGLPFQTQKIGIVGQPSSVEQAVAITRAASQQTYLTIRLLVDRDRIANAYRAYGYFRWLDDTLDQQMIGRAERLAFVERQKALMEFCYRGEEPNNTSPQEQMLVRLIASDQEPYSGLQSYIENMFEVMAFDAERQGRLVSQEELDAYSLHLASAVTEALHYFIGHDDPPPLSEARYLAATAAHITHMLRDTYEDIHAGYFNIPGELLISGGSGPCDIEAEAYRAWARDRVALARRYFQAGKRYLAQVNNWRCRLAGYGYIARFWGILDTIERDGFLLRRSYALRRTGVLSAFCSIMWLTFGSRRVNL